MHSRLSNLLVLAFWLVTMVWLVATKFLPPLLLGEPPSYRTILKASQGEAARGPERWRLYWNETEVGWAETEIIQRQEELSEIRSQMRIEQVPLKGNDLLGVGHFVRLLNDGQATLSLDAESVVAVDPLGRLEEFRSRLGLGGLPEAIRVQGRVDGKQLLLTVRSGDFVYRTKTSLPSEALVWDVLSPQSQLTRLRVGQSWAVPIYSPFRMPTAPMQLMQAKVEQRETLLWNGQHVVSWVVVYRSDEGAGLRHSKVPMGRMWVDRQGRVLQQEARVLGAVLKFIREPVGGSGAPRATAERSPTAEVGPGEGGDLGGDPLPQPAAATAVPSETR